MYKISKRILDLLIALPAALVSTPVLAVIVIIIRLTSKGPAVFTQERAGKDAEPFIIVQVPNHENRISNQRRRQSQEEIEWERKFNYGPYLLTLLD